MTQTNDPFSEALSAVVKGLLSLAVWVFVFLLLFAGIKWAWGIVF